MPIQELENTLEYKVYDLKKGVDFIGVTCVFFCHDGKGNILLHKRSQFCRDEQGCWDNGGGSMEFGEGSFEEVVRREVLEEYKIEALHVHHVATTNLVRNNKGVKTHWVCLVHEVLVPEASGEIGEPHKAEDIGWFAHDALPSPLHSAVEAHLELIRHRIVPVR